LLIGCVIQNGLEHAGEPEMFAHDANGAPVTLVNTTGSRL
jgi:hypothetical protein